MTEQKGRLARIFDGLKGVFSTKTTPTPQMPLWSAGIQEPAMIQGITRPALYVAANESAVLRTILTNLKQEVFRRGWHWEKRFERKCTNCKTEYKHQIEECSVCDSTSFYEPSHSQLAYADKLFKERNSCDQTFIEVLRSLEDDMNIVDDAFLVIVKEYYLDPETKKAQFFRVKELLRGDPIFMRVVADKRGVRGGKWWTCIAHRSVKETEEGTCPDCGATLHDVHFINTSGYGGNQLYVEGEVAHFSKYSPSKLYGTSPVATLWRLINTLVAMENYVYTAYQKRRMPRGILAIKTSNLESMSSFWRSINEKLERDPHYIPKVGIETESGRGGVDFVRFMDTLEEMQYIPVKDDLRQRISAMYGVSNVFMQDTSAAGGLNNEGMQILVTNRAVESGQKVWHDVVFPRLLDALGITDWRIRLRPSEEEDEISRLRRNELEVNIATRMQQLGFHVHLDQDEAAEGPGSRELKFRFKEPTHEEKQEQDMAQKGQPGMPTAGMQGPSAVGGGAMGMPGVPMLAGAEGGGGGATGITRNRPVSPPRIERAGGMPGQASAQGDVRTETNDAGKGGMTDFMMQRKKPL